MGKFLLLATVAVLPGVAVAADMPVKAYNAVTPDPVANWQGFYFGGQVGGSWNVIDSNFKELGSLKPNGMVWGFHAGHNWQPIGGPVVLGLELAYTNYTAKKDAGLGICLEGCELVADGTLKIRYVADALAKAGFTPMPTVLVYGTAGVSWAAITFDNAGTNAFGWAAGGGLDWMPFGKNIIIGARYLYRDLGKPAGTVNDMTGQELTGRISAKF